MFYKNKSSSSTSPVASNHETLYRTVARLTMDSRADMRNVTTILLSEDSSSSTGRVDIATWAMIPVQEKKEESETQCPAKHKLIAVRVLHKLPDLQFSCIRKK